MRSWGWFVQKNWGLKGRREADIPKRGWRGWDTNVRETSWPPRAENRLANDIHSVSAIYNLVNALDQKWYQCRRHIFWFEISKTLLNEYVHRMTPPSPRPTATVTPWNHHNDLAMNTFNPSVTLIRFSEILAFAISRPWTENHELAIVDLFAIYMHGHATFPPLVGFGGRMESFEWVKHRRLQHSQRRLFHPCS